MAEYTTHYNLKKPAKNENYNIDVANENNDIIDEKLYGKVDKKAGKDLSTNDFTNEYKKKLDSLKNYDDAEVIKQITSFNERADKVEEANTEISKNIEALKTDNETNKTAISELKETTAQNNETITAIQEEQTTQNENIEKNAEGIAQNKKDVDEELTKIKKENSLLKSQIPTGTASGNSIHLEDSSNMDFEWKLRGESYQKVKPYNNLVKNADFKSDLNEWKASSKFSVVNKNGIKYLKISTSTAGFNRAYQGLNTIAEHKYYVAMKCIKDKAWVSAELFLSASLSDNYPQPAKSITSNIYQNETSVSTILVPKSSNCSIGVMFQSSNTDEVWEAYLRDFICIDLTELYGEGNEPDQTTCDNLFTFDKVAYGTSPSAYTLSQIENVGDKINILNKDVVNATNNLRSNVLETGIRLIANKAGNYTYGAFKLGGRELLGKTLGVHADIETKSGNPRISIFAENSSSLTKSLLQVVLSASGTGYITIPSNLNSELDTISAVLYVTTDTSVVAGTYVDYTNLKVQVGDGEVIYSDYKKANIQMTKCNENYGNAELLYNQMSDFYSAAVRKEIVDGKNCIVFNNTAFRGDKGFSGLHFNYKKNTRYVIRGKFRVYDTSITSGGDLWVMALNKDNASIGYSRAQAKGSEWIQFSFFTNINFSFDHIAFSYGTGTYWCLDMDSLEIYEGTSVREVPKSQVQTITFPLEEGQKLYEGSYLAADAIHNKRKQIVLTGNENIFESQLGTYQTFGIVISGIKQGTKLMSNYFTSYPTITDIKYKAGMTNNNAADRLYISNGESSKTEEFKAWLSQRLDEGIPVIIEYELATEEIIPYTPEQQAVIDKILYTYKNVTNISVDNKLATLDITYKKDIETMFNNQAKEYNERLSNIENLLNTTETSALLLDNLENDLKEEV